MPRYLYWRHKQTSEFYAVRVNDDGLVDGNVGPIPHEEAKHTKLTHWTITQKDGEQLRRRFLEFELFTIKRYGVVSSSPPPSPVFFFKQKTAYEIHQLIDRLVERLEEWRGVQANPESHDDQRHKGCQF